MLLIKIKLIIYARIKCFRQKWYNNWKFYRGKSKINKFVTKIHQNLVNWVLNKDLLDWIGYNRWEYTSHSKGE